MLRFENVASPPTAATAAVPDSVPFPGLLPSAMVTLPVNVGTRVPCASCAATTTAGAMTLPARVGEGCVTKASFAAAPKALWAHCCAVRPGALTWNAAGPDVDGSVTSVWASPLASVTTCGVVTAPPAGGTKVTTTPLTPSPSPAVTLATTGSGSWVPSRPLCPHPLTIASTVATGAKVMDVDAVTPFGWLWVFGVRAMTLMTARDSGAVSTPVMLTLATFVSLVVQDA